MTKKCVIRPGRYEDMFVAEKLLAASLSESAVPVPPIEIPHIYHWYVKMVSEEMIYVADINQKLVGLIALGIERWPWTSPNGGKEGMLLNMPGLYVLPEYRKYGTAMRLIQRGEQKATALGLPFMINTSNGVDPDNKDRFIRMMGFTQAGGAFWKAPA